VDFGVAPAALPPAPVGASTPVPAVSWGATPGTDTATTPPAEEKPFNPFYFTRFTWENTASAQSFGVGKDYQSPAPTYTMTFLLNLRYYFLNRPLDKAYVNVAGGVDVEVTDSANTGTTTKHQPLFEDMVLSVGYGRTLYQSADKQWKTTIGPRASFTLPTSIATQGQGKYFTTNLDAIIAQALPLAGNKSDWFSDLLAFGTVGYYHTFSRCKTACNNIASSYPRSNGAGNYAGGVSDGDSSVAFPNTTPDDQLAGGGLVLDKVKFNLTYYLTIYKDLSLGNTWEVFLPIKPSFSATTIDTPTGPVQLGSSVTAVNPVTTFDVSLSYLLFNTARIDVGYQNIGPELVDNMGKRNSVFYSIGGSAFYGNVALYIDSLIDRAINKQTTDTHTRRVAGGRFHAFPSF
jgi:hypothetical protein